MRDQDDPSQVLYQLFSMIVNILSSPPLPIPFPIPNTFDGATAASSSSAPLRQPPQVSPLGFAGLFIAISLAMILFGSAIVVIGFMVLPLVIALVMLFYVARVVSTLSYLASIVIFSSRNIVSVPTDLHSSPPFHRSILDFINDAKPSSKADSLVTILKPRKQVWRWTIS